MLRACWKRKDRSVWREVGHDLEPPARQFLEGGRCRRICIDEMDGRKDRQRCEPGEEKCDLCQQNPGGIKRAMDEEQNKDEAAGQAKTKVVVERMAGIAMEQRRVEIGQRRRMEQKGYEPSPASEMPS